MTKNLNKDYKTQALIGLVMVVIYATQGQAQGAAYGFFVGIINVLLLSFTFSRANKYAENNAQAGMLIVYTSAVVRFVLLAILFILGLSFLDKSQAFPVVLTFVLMQVGQLFNLKSKRRLTD